ncbi:MAG: hypothetical protein AAAFM81_02005 [Pseudomonadota bacterium]
MYDNTSSTKTLTARLVRYAALDGVAVLLIALAIYALAAGPERVFHPLLADSTLVNVMLGFGIIMAVWTGLKLFATIRELAAVNQSQGG